MLNTGHMSSRTVLALTAHATQRLLAQRAECSAAVYTKIWFFLQISSTIIPFKIFGAAPKDYPKVSKKAHAVRADLATDTFEITDRQ